MNQIDFKITELKLHIVDDNLQQQNVFELVNDALTDTRGLSLDIVNPIISRDGFSIRNQNVYNYNKQDFGIHFSSESKEYFMIVCERLKRLNIKYWVSEISYEVIFYEELEKVGLIYADSYLGDSLNKSMFIETEQDSISSIKLNGKISICDLNKEYINNAILSNSINHYDIKFFYSNNICYVQVEDDTDYVKLTEESSLLIKFYLDKLLDEFTLVTPKPHILPW